MATNKPTEKAAEPIYDPMKDLVTVHLPRAEKKQENFELVGLNGKMYKIMRGRPVRVPRPVSDILLYREKQRERAAAFEASVASNGG